MMWINQNLQRKLHSEFVMSVTEKNDEKEKKESRMDVEIGQKQRTRRIPVPITMDVSE